MDSGIPDEQRTSQGKDQTHDSTSHAADIRAKRRHGRGGAGGDTSLCRFRIACGATENGHCGAGRMRHSHTPGYIQKLKDSKDVRVKYVWDTDAKRAKNGPTSLGARAVPDEAAVWADPQVQARSSARRPTCTTGWCWPGPRQASISSWRSRWAITAPSAARWPRPSSRPGCSSPPATACAPSPPICFLKQQIAQGTFGKITRIRGFRSATTARWVMFDGEIRWMADPKIAGCGGFGDLGTHGLDLLMWLVGGVEAVTADIKVVTGRYGPCDESGEALIRFKSGVTGTLAAGWVDVANPNSLEISGTEGHAGHRARPTVLQACQGPRRRRKEALDCPALGVAAAAGDVYRRLAARPICRWSLPAKRRSE